MSNHHRNHTFLENVVKSEYFHVNQIMINLQIYIYIFNCYKFLGHEIKAALYGILRKILCR